MGTGTLMDPLALGVGFLGFSPEVASRLIDWTGEKRREDCGWFVAPPEQADVWCIDGRSVTSLRPDGFSITTEATGGRPVDFHFKDAPPLLAVASRSPGSFQGAVPFDAQEKTSAVTAFRTLEARLAPLRCEYALGGALVWHQDDLLASGVYHLVYHGRLLGVADLRRRVVGFPLMAVPADLIRADWNKRPDGAGEVPESFIVRTPSELLWTYAVRTRTDILPTRYRRKPIFFRGLPRISIDRLGGMHVKVMALLQAGPMTLAQMVHALGGSERSVTRWLAALHAVGVVSTTPPGNWIPAAAGPSSEMDQPHALDSAFWRSSETARAPARTASA